MTVQQQRSDEEPHAVEARLLLGDGEVIAGTVAAGCESSRPFHGWLELMDALDAIRTGETCNQQEES
ncbi:MAG: hypothetical protein KDB58_03840 [Solirubrobacterales bacterium]|nr:hypothetical protein [Solirubrobacterales bacterium]